MRTIAPVLAAGIMLALGCSGSGSQSPLAPVNGTPDLQSIPTSTPFAGSVQTGLGGAVLEGAIAETALAVYTLEVDPASLTATARLKETRKGAANDDLYLLSIDSFLRADSLRVRSVSASAETLDLTCTIAHPFPAAMDPAGTPNGSTNRADLGIAGRVLVLADVASATGNTYFDETGIGGGQVVANTALLANADAYTQPAGLLNLSGTANTFPYKVLVDESGDGSRVGVSNGGDPTGNFGAEGWTRDKMGSSRDQWTGYGVLHQGQTSQITFALRKDALSGPFSLDLAVLAKYNDPRGGQTPGQKKANRLPGAVADTAQFAYRMPHGALDVEALRFLGDSGGFWTNELSASTMEFHVTDWDARAQETTEADLALDADPTLVALGESGLPALAVSIPGVLGGPDTIDQWDPGTTVIDDDSAHGGDAGQDSGRPGDALYYRKDVIKTVTSGQTDGTYTGMVRATDVEDALDPSLTFALDGSLGLLTSNLPRPVAYQAFSVDMITPNTLPVATFTLAASPILSATTATVVAIGYGDGDGDAITVDVDWNGDGLFTGPGETAAAVLPGAGGPPVNIVSPSTYINTDLVNDVYTLAVRFTDGQMPAPIDAPGLSLTVGPNRPPVISGTPVLAAPVMQAPANFTIQAGTITASDPENDPITFVVSANVSPTGPFGPSATLPLNGIGPFGVGSVQLTLYARDLVHTNLTPAQPDSAVAYPAVTGTIQPCPVAPYTASSISTFFNSVDRTINAVTNSQWGWLDMGSVTFPNAMEIGAVVVTNTDSGGAPYFPFLTQQFQYLTAPVDGTPAKANMTAFPNAYVIDPTTGRDMINLMVHQIDIDPTGRVLFLTRHRAGDQRAIGGLDAGSEPGIYDPAGNLHEGIKWFDYNYTTGATVSALGGVIDTGGITPVALAIDPTGPEYAVWTLDALHVLRKYVRTGATTYAEVPAATMDISPIIGSNTGTGDTNRKVHDFVYSAYNGAFFVLVQSQAAATAPGNGYVYRIECNGAFDPNLNGPATNPARMTLNASITQNYGADIVMDQHDSTGALLTGQQDVQILVCSYYNSGTLVEARVMNAMLGITATINNNQRWQTAAISYNNAVYTKGGSVFTQYDYFWPSAAPAGWQ